MFGFSWVMFFISTWHFAMNGYHVFYGFVNHVGDEGGAIGYINNLRRWDDVVTNTLYATQEILGGAAAIYRCFILWNKDWRVIALPLMLLTASIVSGYTVCALFAQIDPTLYVFESHLQSWIKAFYSIAVVQNIITTGLMAFRIYRTSSKSAKYRTESALIPILRILIESAALQLVVEIVLLALYSSNNSAQRIPQLLIAPIVGITFNAISIRIKLRAIGNSHNSSSQPGSPVVQTIGSLPMKRIKIDITTQVEDDADADSAAKESLHGSPV
ncbi:hypothetical protein PC9H_010348 [Pleurotus ostreatus]|uniref:Uncharacterized protein n=1 Tax=Pleurotus ostreatus TaxID=5322 RepID=A0A8H6ZNK6_PLEOS|nr:uncharacterized protein PC9H_010348 [Pleurotus ostreatus]KAF7422193.1 hypothetical protein PC9H_010348 [Pleurotus ostreatus]